MSAYFLATFPCHAYNRWNCLFETLLQNEGRQKILYAILRTESVMDI